MRPTDPFPVVRTLGVDGVLVSFSDSMSDAANRAALAFRQSVEREHLSGMLETSSSLASTYIRFDPGSLSRAALIGRLSALLKSRDWFSAPLPDGRRLWRVPTVYGTHLAPQLDEAAAAAGLSAQEAINRLSSTRVRVLTIGFAPGQPYLGPLGPEFDIPRLQDLTPMVPEGALVLAISQFVLFSGPTPTGWRHIGQTAFRCFRPEMAQPFALGPGDEMLFEPVSPAELDDIQANNHDGNGGATCEAIAS